jgi:acyl-CoA synthetase (AMP-forming)/AMP-acid ligase II
MEAQTWTTLMERNDAALTEPHQDGPRKIFYSHRRLQMKKATVGLAVAMVMIFGALLISVGEMDLPMSRLLRSDNVLVLTPGFVVPTMINMFLQVPDLETYDFGSMRMLYYGAAPMPIKLLERALKAMPCGFMQFFGQTEAFLMAALPPEDHIVEGPAGKVRKSRAAGKAMVNYELRIVDGDDKDVPVGEVGEIIAKSASVTLGYWDRPDETAQVLKNGWLHTGDLAYMDEDGYIYVVERKKDMIICGGKNIYCPEIEDVLYKHPAVLEATVFGVPDDHWGESVKAAVVLKEGKELTEDELVNFCSENLAGYKKPKSVDFLPELPKSPAGKILKRVLRDKYWENAEKKI